MPTPMPPPTPGSSGDLKGKEGVENAPTFHLPPNALQDADRVSSATPSAHGSDSSYRPISPASPTTSAQKRSATQSSTTATKNGFALPPPPTRSRKIIQVKPQEAEQQQGMMATASDSQPIASKRQSGPAPKKRQNNTNTSAAGRKIARKTAHSLIERRRRSKMNEEFDVLKNMIPACNGQEMHKLAILQASIEYMNYLEQCVSDLKAQSKTQPSSQRHSSIRAVVEMNDDDDDDDEEMEDQDETATSTSSTAPQDRSDSRISLPSLSQLTSITSVSPSTFSVGAARHYSVSSTSQASFSPYIDSNQASPAFGPQLSKVSLVGRPQSGSRETFGLGSPALKALDSSNKGPRSGGDTGFEVFDSSQRSSKSTRSEKELDREATAALLMLNHDRRNWSDSRDSEALKRGKGSSGMSVKDLLSG